MKRIFVIYLISVFAVSLGVGWMFSRYTITPSKVISTDWEGRWEMDSEAEKGPVHGILELSGVKENGFKYSLIYTYDRSSGGDNSNNFPGKVQMFRNEIAQTWYFDNGDKNVVRTLTLSKDKKSIYLYENTCPGLFNISPTPDGCEIPVYNGTYHRVK